MNSSVESARRRRPSLPPGPRFLTPFPFLRQLRERPLEFVSECWREYGDVVCARIPPFRSLILVRPEHLRHVLVTNHRNYWKGKLFDRLRVVAGEGLLFAEGERWLRRRRTVAPAFQRSHVESLVPHMTRAAEDLLDRWRAQHEDGEPFDLLPEMSKVALDIVSRALFGTDILEHADEFHRHLNVAVEYTNYLVNHQFTPPLWVPTRRNRALRRSTAFARELIGAIIADHRAAPPQSGDLLGLLMAARDDETGARLGDDELYDELMTFLNAGHETTAVTLAWALYALGREPEWTERARAEVDRVLDGRVPVLDDLPRLELVGRVVMETLRLYPPAWSTVREALAEDEIGGHAIPAKATVALCFWLTHRHPALWEEPERFDPDRFLPERVQERPRLAWVPFGAGGRRCIGEEFAMLEAQLLLAAILARHEVTLVPGREPRPYPLLTLRPQGGVWATLRRRR